MSDDYSGGSEQLHPIGVVAERTGLTPELLRVWERRYGAVAPLRGAGGSRLYSDEDVARLRLLTRAVRAGRQIGQVARLSPDALRLLVQGDARDREERSVVPAIPERPSGHAEQVIAACVELAGRLDGGALEELLRREAARKGLSRFLEGIVAPLLKSVGDEWHAGRLSVAQEHLASRVIQRVVTSFFDALRPPPAAPVFVAASLAGDRHEMGVLLSAATAAAEGWEVVLLGSDLPALEVSSAARARSAAAVGISVVFVDSPEELAAKIAQLRNSLPPDTALLIGGGSAASLDFGASGENVQLLNDLAGLRETLRRLIPPS